jgi:mercuric ion transport protein
MPTIDFVYDLDCPNISSARANLMRALSKAGVPARWQEHRIGDPEAPDHVRGFGSPTILIDGRDVGGLEPAAESCCRLYAAENAMIGSPSVEDITAAIVRAASTPPRPTRLRTTVAALPAVGVALMPKIVCPLCWPAYVGLLSATGLTFLMEDRWLLPISALFLLAALVALGWRAEKRRGYGPAIAGLFSSVAILAGKFAVESDVAVYGGIAALIAACVWNAWPRRAVEPLCAACISPPQA